VTPKNSLASVTRAFAAELKDLLNTTVCDSAYIGVLQRPDGNVILGTELRKLGRAVPVRLRERGDVPLWLTVHMRTSLDPEGHLVTQESTYTFSKGHEPVELLHYDYERDKLGYPDAHVQVVGGSSDWDDVLVASGRPRGGLGKLHLTVGGRRYRPSVEDVIDMLIAEKFLNPKPGTRERLDASRDAFQRRQLRAAIRRDPDAAVLELRAAGYRIAEPDQVLRRELVRSRTAKETKPRRWGKR
jgi:hypothetical protein